MEMAGRLDMIAPLRPGSHQGQWRNSGRYIFSPQPCSSENHEPEPGYYR